MVNEVWKKIKEYENYSVSNYGNVRNDKKEMNLKKLKQSNGYVRVCLYKNGIPKHFLIHRLVAEAFIMNPFNKPYVDHINTIRDDNRVDNLRWCTQRENCNNELTRKHVSNGQKGKTIPKETREKLSKAHKGKTLTEKTKKKMGESRKGINNPISRKIVCVTTKEIFDYILQAEEKYKTPASNIIKCCKGKRKSSGKHPLTKEKLIWTYYEDYLKKVGEFDDTIS